MEVIGQLHASAALSLGNNLRYPLERRVGGPHRAGLDAVTKRKNSVITPARNWTPVIHPAA